MQNTLPIMLGSVTIFGVTINNNVIFFWSCIFVMLTASIVMIKIIRSCNRRNRRVNSIGKRRRDRDANTADTTARFRHP